MPQDAMHYWESLTPEQRVIYGCFETLDPAIADCPHCIVYTDRQNTETILSIVPEPAIWAGLSLSYLVHCAPILSAKLDLLYPDVDDFDEHFDDAKQTHLWTLPELQALIPEYFGRFDDNVNLHLPATASEAVRTRIRGSHKSIEELLATVIPASIDELGWCLVPACHDNACSVFITSERYRNVLDLAIGGL